MFDMSLPFTFTAGLIVDEIEPIHALYLRATCRQASRILSPRTAAAIAFALTRKGTVTSEAVGTWLHVWKACAEAAEAHGHDASAWANSWHVFVAPPMWQSDRQNELALRAFGVSEATLTEESMRRFMGFMESLVAREAKGIQQLTVVSILASRLIIFPEEYHLSHDHGLGFQSSSLLLLSDGQFAVTRIWYSPYVMHFNHGDVRSSYKLTFAPGEARSSCRLTGSLADLSNWTVDDAGRLLTTLPPTRDESAMPRDLKEELRHMFRQGRTHEEKRLYSGTSTGLTCLRRCEEAKPSGAFHHKLAVQLSANRPRMWQRFPGTATPGQRQQAVSEIEGCQGEDTAIQTMRYCLPAGQHFPIESRDSASLQRASFVDYNLQEGVCAEPHAGSTMSVGSQPPESRGGCSGEGATEGVSDQSLSGQLPGKLGQRWRRRRASWTNPASSVSGELAHEPLARPSSVLEGGLNGLAGETMRK